MSGQNRTLARVLTRNNHGYLYRARARPNRRGASLPSVGRNVSYRYSKTTVVTAVWVRGVGDSIGKHRGLARRDFNVDRLAFVYAGDLLAASEQIILMKSLFVLKVGPKMASGQHPHASAFQG